jgi:hypothetical protein
VFKKFFGKKNDGFFIQLEEEDAKSTPAAKAAPKEAPQAAPAPTTPPAAPAPASTVAAPAAKSAKTDKKSAKTAETPKVEPAPVVAAAPAPTITNFATDYLIKPSSMSGRRRPGANMRQFMDLARQVDKQKPFKATAVERKAAEKPVEKAAAKSTEPSSK